MKKQRMTALSAAKTKKRMTAVGVCLSFLPVLALFSSLTAWAAGAAGSVIPAISGETDRITEEIRKNDGGSTGVLYSQIGFSGRFGNNKMMNVVEFDLSDPHLSVEVLNCGNTIADQRTVDKAAADASGGGRTVLAALNGDLWMTKVHSSPAVTTKVLATTRGVMIIDREIYATEQIGMENYAATNAEQGTSSPPKAAFGVTSENQPLVGSPVITARIKNLSAGGQITADGINRLPAWDSLILYNARVNSANYALNDAYEIELEADDPAIRLDGRTVATVKRIYPSGSAERPAIGAKTILLTARGNKIPLLSGIGVGDRLEISADILDRYGNTELWKNVADAIGGNIMIMRDGKPEGTLGSGEYPSSLIGYNDEGKVIFCSITAQKNADGSHAKAYKGLDFSQASAFCRELGYNSVFYLDGGGSSTIVTLEKGSCTIRNNCSDGAPRPVINAVAVCYNDTPVCEKQGSLSYIRTAPDIGKLDPRYLDGALIAELLSAPHDVTCSVTPDGAARLKTTVTTADPYMTLGFDRLRAMEASEYPYVVCRVSTNCTYDTGFCLYYGAGSDTAPAEGRTVAAVLQGNTGKSRYLTFDFSGQSRWKGQIRFLRLDPFNGSSVPAGCYADIEAMIFCRTAEEAGNAAAGQIPKGDGIVTDYIAYLNGTYPGNTEDTTDTKGPADTDDPPVTAGDTTAETTGDTAGNTTGEKETVPPDTVIPPVTSPAGATEKEETAGSPSETAESPEQTQTTAPSAETAPPLSRETVTGTTAGDTGNDTGKGSPAGLLAAGAVLVLLLSGTAFLLFSRKHR